MRKWIIVLLIVFVGVAMATKPDDKTCIIKGVQAVWGPMVPDPEATPQFFEQFMDQISQNVKVRDWLLFKQVTYGMAEKDQTIAYGAFTRVYATVKPMDYKPSIPRMQK